MRNASRAFRAALLEDQRDYLINAKITLADGTVLDLENDFIWVSGLSINDAVSADNVFQIGGAIVGQCTLRINNIDDEFSAYDFSGAEVIVYTGLDIDGTPEMLRMGTYDVDAAEYNGSIITLTCLDNLTKFDKPYDTNLVYPATLQDIVLDAYAKCLGSSSMGDSTFPSYQYQVSDKPSSESTTYRQVLSWAAQIAGCFVRCDAEGKIRFRWYDTAAIDSLALGLDGGIFDGGGIGTIALAPYLNTTEGMTDLTTAAVDDRWFSIPNDLEIPWGGAVSDYIFIDSDSCIAFANTAPSSHGHTMLQHINICTRDGKAYDIKYQIIEDEDLSAVKYYWNGYTQYNSTAESYALTYELFITADKRIFVNFIKLPDSEYRGTSSIVESGVSTSFTPKAGIMYACRVSAGWAIQDTGIAYQSGDTADGGSFDPWNTGYEYDAGALADVRPFHVIASAYSQNLSTDDVVITGVKVIKKVKGESSSDAYEEYTYGDPGYVVSVEGNEFVQGNHGQDVADALGAALVGLQFRKAEIMHPSDPTMEAGDVGLFYDRKGNQYTILISATDFTAGSSQRTISSAETPKKNTAQRYSEATRNYVEMRQRVEEEKTERELAEAELQRQISQSGGLYFHQVADGSAYKYYLHNKPELADSPIQILFSTAGITVTSDYGAHWYGLTVNGEMLINLLSATGINFSWARGGTLTLGGSNNENGSLRILNSSGVQIATINNSGISVSNGKFVVDTNGNVTAMSLAAYGSFICYESYTVSE